MDSILRKDGKIIYMIDGKRLVDVDEGQDDLELQDLLNKVNETINFDVKKINYDEKIIKQVKQEIEEYVFMYLKKMHLPRKLVFGINTEGVHLKTWFIFNGGNNKDIIIDTIKTIPFCAKVVYDSVEDIIELQLKVTKNSDIYQEKYDLNEEVIKQDETFKEYMIGVAK